LIEKPEEKRPLGRQWHRWEGNIRMALGQIGWEGVCWIHVTQDRDQWRALTLHPKILGILKLNVSPVLNSIYFLVVSCWAATFCLLKPHNTAPHVADLSCGG